MSSFYCRHFEDVRARVCVDSSDELRSLRKKFAMLNPRCSRRYLRSLAQRVDVVALLTSYFAPLTRYRQVGLDDDTNDWYSTLRQELGKAVISQARFTLA